ncbi:TPA: hypothetical protein R1902_000514 [Staphylococcus delphini]|nr:hypothetical protein [Staphylococcus delphini]HEC2148087.1 hypothetical protein [Staphylococcus delphini]HEC2150756.1 hypothetical protein [Staphylococcus delphini]HEC2159512.1 hypothetical protein [Staphylococcus delphini]HEC2177487.1 hypothetical protein [Staphylococcus delphini]
MKKVIFEQTGNIITTLLLLATSFEIINNFKGESYNFQISFGVYSFALTIWLLVFTVSRVIYSKFDKQYDIKKGEYSVSDEREEVISQKASIGAYKTVTFTLLVFFLITVVMALLTKLLVFNIVNFYVISLLFLGISIITGFLAYLLIWIVLYLK